MGGGRRCRRPGCAPALCPRRRPPAEPASHPASRAVGEERRGARRGPAGSLGGQPCGGGGRRRMRCAPCAGRRRDRRVPVPGLSPCSSLALGTARGQRRAGSGGAIAAEMGREHARRAFPSPRAFVVVPAGSGGLPGSGPAPAAEGGGPAEPAPLPSPAV